MRAADESRAAAILCSCAAAVFFVVCTIATSIYLDEQGAGWSAFVRSGMPIFGGVVALAALMPRMGSQFAGIIGVALVVGVTWTSLWTWSFGLMAGSFGLFLMTLSMAALTFDAARRAKRVGRAGGGR